VIVSGSAPTSCSVKWGGLATIPSLKEPHAAFGRIMLGPALTGNLATAEWRHVERAEHRAALDRPFILDRRRRALLPLGAAERFWRKGTRGGRQRLCGAMLGPTLAAIVGRRAATIQGFDYTSSLKSSGLVWDAGSRHRQGKVEICFAHAVGRRGDGDCGGVIFPGD
jgi:hypothetical protein